MNKFLMERKGVWMEVGVWQRERSSRGGRENQGKRDKGRCKKERETTIKEKERQEGKKKYAETRGSRKRK